MSEPVERESMEVDVLFVGAGPATLASAIHPMNRVEAANRAAEAAGKSPIEPPTVLVLDGDYQEMGCWVERPSVLQAWAIENKEDLGDAFGPKKMAWYRKDWGRSTLDEVVVVLEAAAAGHPSCETG